MKKVFTSLLLLGFIIGSVTLLNARPNEFKAAVTIADELSLPNRNVLVPVTADFDMGEIVRSFEFRINIEKSHVLQFVDMVDVDPVFVDAISYDDIDDADFLITWEAPTGNLEVAEGFTGTLFYLEFSFTTGSSEIVFIGKNEVGVTEVGGATTNNLDKDKEGVADAIFTDFTDGSVSEIEVPVPLANWSIFVGLLLMLGFVAARAVRIL